MLGRFHNRGIDILCSPKKTANVLFAVFLVFGLPLAASAAPITTPNLGLPTGDLQSIIVSIIQGFLSLIGLIAVSIIIYAGFQWMTSGGDAEKIKTAQGTIRDAVIGLIIIGLSYSIVLFVAGIFEPQQSGGNLLFTGSGALPFVPSGDDNLGNGIIEDTYPTNGQKDVPRNIKVLVTFKHPFKLSTIFNNYDDNGTPQTDDDKLCAGAPPCPTGTPVTSSTPLQLNTANVKVIRQTDIASANNFDAKYAKALAPSQLAANVTVISSYDTDEQTLKIAPNPYLGSPMTDVDYRVAFRGGDAGIKVWVPDVTKANTYNASNAFANMYPDGAYYWSFTTNTTIDLTPPKILSVYPLVKTPLEQLYRNDMIQITFDKPVDPVTVTGKTGSGQGRGFNFLDVQAECITGQPCDAAYKGSFAPVSGAWTIGNQYRTVQFLADAPCDNVSVNSCGQRVYCLPKNVNLHVIAVAATLGAQPPQSVDPANGIADLVGNSFDGNTNGKAEGPTPQGEPRYLLNAPNPTVALHDNELMEYTVGTDVDLVPPQITDILPKSSSSHGTPSEQTAYPDGPSNVDTVAPIEVTWSKVMSVTSMRSGTSGDVLNGSESTVALNASELKKTGACDPNTKTCPVAAVPTPPSFTIGSHNDNNVTPTKTVMDIAHRAFLKSQDLGYTAEEASAYPDYVPRYQPIIGSKIQDTRQNCFYPSLYSACSGGSDPFCCDDTRGSRADFTKKCNL